MHIEKHFSNSLFNIDTKMIQRIILYMLLFCFGAEGFAQTLNLMYYVSARPGEHGMWVARQLPNGSWLRGEKVLIDGVFDGNGVDPDIFKQNDGSLRLYYFQGYFVSPPPQNPGPNPIYSAVSTDGIRFTGKRKVFEYDNVFDPSVVQLPNGSYVMGCTQMIGNTVNTVVATSNDGLTFTYKTTVQNTGIPEMMVLQDGSIRLFYNGAGGIVSSRSTDGGTTWQKEQGVRLAYQQFVGDPSVSKVGNVLRMYVKGFNANGGQKLVGHKTQYAESTDGGNTFQMQQQLVLDSASVPEGVEMNVALTMESLSTHDTSCIGEDVVFEAKVDVKPEMLPLTYQWTRNGIQIPNANAAKYTINKISMSDSGAYSVIASVGQLSSGTLSKTYGPIGLSIKPQTTIVNDIQQELSLCHDQMKVVSCMAQGMQLNYQWMKSGNAIIGQQKNEIVINGKDFIDGDEIYCIVKGDCNSDTTKRMKISITPELRITKDLSDGYAIQLGADTVLSVRISSKNCTYQWLRNDAPLMAEQIANDTIITLNISSMDTSKSGRYALLIRNQCDTLASVKAVLSVTIPSSVEEGQSALLFPQPAERVLHLQANNNNDVLKAVLMNVHGTVLRICDVVAGKGFMLIDDIPSGLYFIRMSDVVYSCIIHH
ncbi:hypothetical protein LBMAG35_17170 [Chlorobiota bacterium]|nr:hypothetical protein LBMAG35_17170 [Chlorobiota bacterium]